MIVKPKFPELTLGAAADTVNDATCVRIYNPTAGDIVILNVQTAASFTLPGGAITFVQKASAEELSATGNVLAVSVAFNIS